ncbi:hypothetical protein PoB_001847800 [Plakobranchus ocellatus]|uniref:Uncharacterized protein n=1 Tax=Plakobranchus ocellatus TaxID=259542 RepID=A0AAV3ZC35_9GAST|nr:hypothetical protein PoB_001847800 [Plakobranchus ocellatus]
MNIRKSPAALFMFQDFPIEPSEAHVTPIRLPYPTQRAIVGHGVEQSSAGPPQTRHLVAGDHFLLLYRTVAVSIPLACETNALHRSGLEPRNNHQVDKFHYISGFYYHKVRTQLTTERPFGVAEYLASALE